MVKIYSHSIIPLIEVLALFLALFYTLHYKPNIWCIFVILLFILLPSMTLLFLGYKWVFIIFLMTSSLTAFYYFTNSSRAILDLCFLVLGGMIAEHTSHVVLNLVIFFEKSIPVYIYTSFYLLIFFIFAYLYKSFISKIDAIRPLPLVARMFITFLACITIVVVYLNTFIPISFEEIILYRINLGLQVTYLTFMVTLIIFLTKSVMRHNEFKRITREQEQQLQYMRSLEKVNKEMRKFQHDYANILLTIRGYLDTEDLDGLKEYFQFHILKAEKQTFLKNESFNNLDNLKLVELKGLLATKFMQADQLGITFKIEIPESIDRIDMDIIDLTRIIGIMTDNAIEASMKLEQSQVNIAFMNTNSNSIMIVIENMTENSSINIDELFKESYSTKGEGRGIGLSTVKEILKYYPNVHLDTHIENGWFIQEVIIPNKQLVLNV
nr:GHKL domain-containing protein [Lysinibacillus timonensis]